MSNNQNDLNEIEEDECDIGQEIEIIDITNQEMNDEGKIGFILNFNLSHFITTFLFIRFIR